MAPKLTISLLASMEVEQLDPQEVHDVKEEEIEREEEIATFQAQHSPWVKCFCVVNFDLEYGQSKGQ